MSAPQPPAQQGSGEVPDSPVGVLALNPPPWVSNPPVEAVVFAWGASEDHQLGLDTEGDISSPKVVESLLGIRFMGRSFHGCPLVGGSRNTLAIDADGGLWSWGWNDRGTLGHGHRNLQRKPACVAALEGVRIVQAAIGGWHCLALSEAGEVYCWGGNEYQQCGLVAPDQDEARAPGPATDTDGIVAAAAAALSGTAGQPKQAAPAGAWGVLPPARDLLMPRRCMPGLRLRQVACGGMNSVVLTQGGEVWTWGEPWGEFALELQRAPRKVPGAVGIAAIACGGFHNLALGADGRVRAWGTNDYGQLGNGSTIYSTTPVEVVDLEEVAVADIAAGGWHSMALSADGQIYVWGRGEYGRLGIGDHTGSSKLRPHKVRGLEGHTVVQVAGGGTHSLAVTSGGRLFIWGRASYGRLGLGRGARDAYGPVEVDLPGGHERWRVAAATAGGRHTMCLAVPVRDATRAGSLLGSRLPSRAASIANEPLSNGSAASRSNSSNAAAAAAGGGGTNIMQQVRDGSQAAAASTAAEQRQQQQGEPMPDPFANAAQQQQQQQQQQLQQLPRRSTPDVQHSASPTQLLRRSSAGAGGGGSRPGSQAPPAPGLSAASSYSFAPSPGSSILGTNAGSPQRSAAGGEPGMPYSPSNYGAPSGRLWGVEAVHAATAAAAAAAQLRAGSPLQISAARQGHGTGLSSGGSVRDGHQASLSPRAYPPPSSPSQRGVRFTQDSALCEYVEAANGAGDRLRGPEGREATEPEDSLGQAEHSQLQSEELRLAEEVLLAEEAQASREAAAADAEEAEAASQEQARRELLLSTSADREQALAAAAAALAEAAGLEPHQGSSSGQAAGGGSRPGSRPGTSHGAGAGSQSMRRSGSYQSLPPRSLSPAAAGLQASPRAEPGSGGGAALTVAINGLGLSQRQHRQLAAAMASSYSRMDAARASSAASLPSLSAGMGPGSRRSTPPSVSRIDSDQDLRLGDLSGMGLEAGSSGGSPGGGSPGGGSPGGGSPRGSQSATEDNFDIDSQPGRHVAGSLPERNAIHMHTHLM